MQPPGSRGDAGPAGRYRLRLRERLPRARPWRGGSPDPVPNSEVKPLVAESTAAEGCGRVGCRARRGRFLLCARPREPSTPRESNAPGAIDHPRGNRFAFCAPAAPNKVIHSPKGRTPCDVRRNSGKRKREKDEGTDGKRPYLLHRYSQRICARSDEPLGESPQQSASVMTWFSA